MHWVEHGKRARHIGPVPARPRSEDFVERARIFGQKVRQARIDLNMTQEQLAEAVGMSRNQIQNIEYNANNTRRRPGHPQPANPKLDTVYDLAYALHVDIDYLVDPSRPVETANR